jgi:hypothetical protein
MKLCIHCGETENLTKHHIHPIKWFGSRRTNKWTMCLCEKCHHTIELGILFLESQIGNVKFGTRFKLPAKEYENIAKRFTRKKYESVSLERC